MESTALTRQHQGNSDSDCRESPLCSVRAQCHQATARAGQTRACEESNSRLDIVQESRTLPSSTRHTPNILKRGEFGLTACQ